MKQLTVVHTNRQ